MLIARRERIRASKYRAWLLAQRRVGESLLETSERILVTEALREQGNDRDRLTLAANALLMSRSTKSITRTFMSRIAGQYGMRSQGNGWDEKSLLASERLRNKYRLRVVEGGKL